MGALCNDASPHELKGGGDVTSPAPVEHASAASKLRLDVQGLRAIAVLSVILFHAGLPIPGGFVGVDIFFVISGFVITAMLQRERESRGRLDMRRFYIRRFKRLTPALAVMVAFSVIVSFLLFSPFDQQIVAGQTALGAMFIVANWVIAITTGGYFDPAAGTNPLLHTWSLSVEEQFYVFFPWILALAWFLAAKFGGRRSDLSRLALGRWLPIVAVLGIGAISLFATFYALRSVEISSGYLLGFYSTITRAWEFAAGALLALIATRLVIRSRLAASILGLIASVALVASFFVVSEATPWPGPWTLLPVLATVLLIVVGSHPENPVSRALSTRPMVAIGDRSYSLYLWHWPFIVFAIAIWPTQPYIGVVAAIASVLPAMLSYRFIEEPFRNASFTRMRQAAPAFTAVIAVPAVLAGGMLWADRNVLIPQFEAGTYSTVLEGGIDTVDYNAWVESISYPCEPASLFDSAPSWKGFQRCRQSQPDEPVTVAILGDSHAEHLFPGLAHALPNDNVAFYIDNPGHYFRGDERMNQIFDHLEANPTFANIVVSVNWFGKGVSASEMVESLRPLADPGRHIFITDDNPTFAFGPFQCKYAQGLVLPKSCDMPASQFWPTHDEYTAILSEVAAQLPGATVLETAKYFCTPETCTMRQGDAVLFRDVNHLNEVGTMYLGGMLVAEHPELATRRG